jgi:hypothetical protein
MRLLLFTRPVMALMTLTVPLRPLHAAGSDPGKIAAQAFHQEVARAFGPADGLPQDVQLLDAADDGSVRVFAEGRWYGQARQEGDVWQALPGWGTRSGDEFVLANAAGEPVRLQLPWQAVRQVLRFRDRAWITTRERVYEVEGTELRAVQLPGATAQAVHAGTVSPEGVLHLATQDGLWRQDGERWTALRVMDQQGRAWAVSDVMGLTFDDLGRLWFGGRAGVGCRTDIGWRFFEGKDGLPVSDFTVLGAGRRGEVWMGTQSGLVGFDGERWLYRQGPRWLPDDEVRQVWVDPAASVWVATSKGLGRIERRPMTLAQKAEFYEDEIARYVKRTPYGFVAEAALRRAGDKASADPQDSDNDGLWTAMYGAGECFGYAAIGDEACLRRAQQAFAALRFLQKVTQGGESAPPKGFVARTVRPMEWPDPNVGRLERDRAEQRGDSLWKVIDPRWPRSADGRWFWKCDTSSDELDGHYFFYPLYYDFCAGTEAERERVREVVRDLTDHLLEHGYVLVDHDGQPTRWAVFGPRFLNRDPRWWPERGLNSLSLLSYLAVAAHITGDSKYLAASRDLIDLHGYAQNLMFPKVQQGPGSGNQSDDEMAFMCYYTLLRCSPDEALKSQVRWSFFRYWANEAMEMNPFFNFSYAAHNLAATGDNPWGSFSLAPYGEWFEDAMSTLRGFPLDRRNWPHRNSHRLDLERLRPPAVRDLYERETGRGCRVGGKVLPVENRHFNHWNTDPWQLDYGGAGNELGAGTVFLLPYYMGLYHGFIERPAR